ncbi:hypothetical protein [Arthrobacter woluwensis]|uniref:Uncharacterized protein n=1 Tax=Arthrobacter woluwensis TaxID=156980 RepID=A0A1H4W959_9MICC|nr:hypothetical protein [Arthrobacter woluwensis]SEC89912.1 hypothetical protein SAMN04489745_3458 [Arthrobacter woluwensis]SEC95723.1 hypothetical protein SAMN04489745_3546 [Arthrobacter woluwensis]
MTAERDELSALIHSTSDTFPDSDAGVISVWSDELAAAVLAAGYRRPRVIEAADELDKLGYRAVVLDVFGDALVCMRKNLRGTWWKYPTAYGEHTPEFILGLGPATVLSEGDPR